MATILSLIIKANNTETIQLFMLLRCFPIVEKPVEVTLGNLSINITN